jgi:biopolymer transport protein ExbD
MSLPSELSAQQTGSGPANPDVPPPPEADFERIVVRIVSGNGGPAWQVNDAPVASLVELRGALEGIARIKRDAPVVLDPDANVPLGDVIDVFDLSRLVGLRRSSLRHRLGP